MAREEPKKVFVSYAWESREHQDRVVDFANKLRTNGFDVVLDVFVTGTMPPEGWPAWMERQIRWADFVLCVCTETYRRRCEGEEVEGTGKGVKWEGGLVTLTLYHAEFRNTRFIPVVFHPDDIGSIPNILGGASRYVVSQEDGFEGLERHLSGQPLYVPAVIGQTRTHTPRNTVERVDAAPFWNVPHRRNTAFTGRGQALTDLRNRLVDGSRAALGQAISGLGGMGKTQTAVEYAYRHRETYRAVYWVNADSPLSVQSAYAEIARALGANFSDNEPDQAVLAFKARLKAEPGWLLILDNADDPSWLEPLLPDPEHGHVLLTSRADNFQKLGILQPVNLSELSADEAVDFLLTRCNRQKIDGTERAAALELAVELQGLPLALEQAAAYISQQTATFQRYLTSYRKRGLALVNQHLPALGRYKHEMSVANTWAANFEAVEQVSPAAADLLRLSAFLAPDAIPFELLTRGAAELGPALRQKLIGADNDPLLVNELLHQLGRFSLIQISYNRSCYSIHRVVQSVIRSQMSELAVRDQTRIAIRALNCVFGENVDSCNEIQKQLISHVLVLAKHVEELCFESGEVGELFLCAASFLYLQGDYRTVKELCGDVLKEKGGSGSGEYLGGPQGLYVYANAERVLGNHKAAERCLLKLLMRLKATRGRASAEYAHGLQVLGLLYKEMERWGAAERLYKKALAILESCVENNNNDYINVPKTRTTIMHNMGALYTNTGRYREAESLLREALRARQMVAGDRSVEVAESMNALARLCRRRGSGYQSVGDNENATIMHKKAELYYRRILVIYRGAGKRRHPFFARTLSSLGVVFRAMGQLRKAERCHVRAMKMCQKYLGENNMIYSDAVNNLGFVHVEAGRFDEARRYLVVAMEIAQQILGCESLAYMTSMSGFVESFRLQFRESGALLCMRRLEDALAVLPGVTSLDCARSLCSLASVYVAQGCHAEADVLFRQALPTLRANPVTKAASYRVLLMKYNSCLVEGNLPLPDDEMLKQDLRELAGDHVGKSDPI